MGAEHRVFFWIKRRWFPVALVVVIAAGYGAGRDLAMKHNEQDATQAAQQKQEG